MSHHFTVTISGYGFVRHPRFPEFTVLVMTIQKNTKETWTIYRRIESFFILSEQLSKYVISLPLRFSHPVNIHTSSPETLEYIRVELTSWIFQLIQYPDVARSQIFMEFLSTEANLPPPGLICKPFKNSTWSSSSNASTSANTSASGIDEMDMGDLFHSSSSMQEELSTLPLPPNLISDKLRINDRTAAVALSSKQKVQPIPEPDNEVDASNKSSVTLDDFAMIKVIGKGSFGKVILVRKKDTGKLYAMKVLRKENIIKRNQVEHTKTERHVLSYVRHPFIVSLNYAFQTYEKLYFVLDYCAGGELFFQLTKVQRFNEMRAKFYIAEIILAIEYIHHLDIIYRDLKPENVLLDVNGHIKLTDFGLSKEGIQGNFSGAHSFCGTAEYLAPEILTRAGHGRAVDWWSLGALLYEMLTGLPPFYCRDRSRLFEKKQRGNLDYPSYLSNVAVDLLRRLLEKDPTKRLGCGPDDAWEIKRHLFFADINWDMLKNGEIPPPWKPRIRNILDTSQFDNEFTSMPLVSPDSRSMAVMRSPCETHNQLFKGFTYSQESMLQKGMPMQIDTIARKTHETCDENDIRKE